MKPQLSTILNTVINHFELSMNLVKSDLRREDFRKARHIYFYLASEMTNETTINIGKIVNRDHSTVIHGRDKIKGQLPIYISLQVEIEEIRFKVLTANKLCPDHVDLLQSTINYTKSLLIKPYYN